MQIECCGQFCLLPRDKLVYSFPILVVIKATLICNFHYTFGILCQLSNNIKFVAKYYNSITKPLYHICTYLYNYSGPCTPKPLTSKVYFLIILLFKARRKRKMKLNLMLILKLKNAAKLKKFWTQFFHQENGKKMVNFGGKVFLLLLPHVWMLSIYRYLF